jgi:UDP-glucose:(heptosyl)LPS alpha-1,3-glucosyltransferase
VQHLFADWQGGYALMGWRDQVNCSDFDLLLHPARQESYGMVISEAMAAKVPVVISNQCGAASDVPPEAGAVLPTTATLETWVGALEQQLSRGQRMPGFVRGWREVAQEYEAIYRRHQTGSTSSLRKQSLHAVN